MMRVRYALLLLLLLGVSPVPQTAVPAHVPTWAYDEYWAQGGTASATDVRRYVTYAEGGLGNDKALRDCAGASQRCSAVWYFDPHLIYDSLNCPYSADQQFIDAAAESWYVHDPGFGDAAHRVQGRYVQTCQGQRTVIPVYAANIANPAVRAFFDGYVRRNAGAWDYLFMDDSGATLVDQMYGPGGGFCRGMSPNGWCTTTREIPTDAALLQAQGAFASSLRNAAGAPMKIFANGDPKLLPSSRSFVGAVCENCIVDAGALRITFYARVLESMAAVQRTGADFVLLSTGAAPAGSAAQVAQRLVTTAVAWLGFDEGRTVVWPDLEYNTKNLAVWPEDGLYPTQPVESMSAAPNDIAVAPNVWRREFKACYFERRPIGPCAAVVNGNTYAVTTHSNWFAQSYGHSVALSGGDALDGGTLSLGTRSFDPNATSIPPGQALLLAR
jgi:hypothetical protein